MSLNTVPTVPTGITYIHAYSNDLNFFPGSSIDTEPSLLDQLKESLSDPLGSNALMRKANHIANKLYSVSRSQELLDKYAPTQLKALEDYQSLVLQIKEAIKTPYILDNNEAKNNLIDFISEQCPALLERPDFSQIDLKQGNLLKVFIMRCAIDHLRLIEEKYLSHERSIFNKISLLFEYLILGVVYAIGCAFAVLPRLGKMYEIIAVLTGSILSIVASLYANKNIKENQLNEISDQLRASRGDIKKLIDKLTQSLDREINNDLSSFEDRDRQDLNRLEEGLGLTQEYEKRGFFNKYKHDFFKISFKREDAHTKYEKFKLIQNRIKQVLKSFYDQQQKLKNATTDEVFFKTA